MACVTTGRGGDGFEEKRFEECVVFMPTTYSIYRYAIIIGILDIRNIINNKSLLHINIHFSLWYFEIINLSLWNIIHVNESLLHLFHTFLYGTHNIHSYNYI